MKKYFAFIFLSFTFCQIHATDTNKLKDDSDPLRPLKYDLNYFPDEETQKFRDKVSDRQFFKNSSSSEGAPLFIKEIQELSEHCPDFKMIDNHQLCDKCGLISGPVQSAVDRHVLKNDFSSFKDKEEPTQCWYESHDCMQYAAIMLTLERHPDKDAAISIVNRLRKDGIMNFFKIAHFEKVESLEDAHLVVYEGNGPHFGISRGNGIVESKWGMRKPIFQHKLWQAPKIYGDKANCYKVTFS